VVVRAPMRDTRLVPPTLVEGLHHVTVCVRDLERAKRFYGDVLGLVELERPPFPFDGAWYALGDRQLHLIVNHAARTFRETAQADGLDAHFALRISDYENMLERLRTSGIDTLESRVNPTPWSQLYVADPDGNVLELNVDRS
jgi:glyoxylase I family protein